MIAARNVSSWRAASALGMTVLCAGAIPAALHAQSRPDTSFAVARNGIIDITVRRGRLVVRGTDRVTAELRTNSTTFDLRSSGVSVTLDVTDGMDRRRGRETGRRRDDGDEPDIELTVPRATRLMIHGQSADVSVSDVGGDIEAHLLSGDITLESVGGRAILDAISGDVKVLGGVGDLRVTTVSGDIDARGVRGSIDVSTTSGEVVLEAERATRVTVNGVSSDIRFNGALAPDARLSFTTHSGDVVLRLPESTGGIIDVESFNGEVTGDGMTLLPTGGAGSGGGANRNNRAPRRFEFGGGGSARITISTFNGDVTVERGGRRRNEQ